MILRPRHAVRWFDDRLRHGTPLAVGLPWISWPCIEFLRTRLRPGMRVLEWGGGGSTVFFLKAGCEVSTVESDADWKGRIQSAVDALGADHKRRWDLRYISVRPGNTEDAATYVQSAHAGAPWDVMLVDGIEDPSLARVDCLRVAMATVRPGGLVVLDDAWREKYRAVPETLKGLARREFWGLGPCRLGVTKTDVYEKVR